VAGSAAGAGPAFGGGFVLAPAVAIFPCAHSRRRRTDVSVAVFISAVSVVIALASFVVNLWLNQRATVRARKPVLVFVDDPEQGCWILRNVGNGPALNVLVAQRHDGKWFNPVLVPPFGTDSSFPLTWLGRLSSDGLGTSYSDFENRRYTSTLGGERSRTYEKDRLPDWRDEEIRRFWELGDGVVERHWAERTSGFAT
jgi:hypothetical protein